MLSAKRMVKWSKIHPPTGDGNSGNEKIFCKKQKKKKREKTGIAPRSNEKKGS